MNKKQQKHLVFITLVVLLLIRTVASLLVTLSGMAVLASIWWMPVFLVLYTLALVGVVKNLKWGGYLASLAGMLDLLVTLSFSSGGFAFGALSVDIIIIALGYLRSQTLK